MAKTQKLDKALALLGVEKVEWFPTIRATADGAHRLTEAIVTMAYHALEEERNSGSEIPPLTIRQMDPKTGELVDKLNLAYEALLRERALYYLQSLGLEAQASQLEILADIFQRQLYLHHPDQWGSLSDFLRNMAAGKSASYQSVIERLVTVILPFLHVEKLATIKEMMTLITEGGFSNLYFLLPELTMAAEEGNSEAMAELLTDAKSLGREEIWKKHKGAKLSPARARLTSGNPHPGHVIIMEEKHAFLSRRQQTKYQLVIEMDEKQKQIILNRLGRRINYE